MFPMLTFTAGLLAGAVAVRLLKSDKAGESFSQAQARLRDAAAASVDIVKEKAHAGLDAAEERLREASLSGLNAIERSSAELRSRLTPKASVSSSAHEPAEVPKSRKSPRKTTSAKSRKTGKSKSTAKVRKSDRTDS